MSGDVTATLKKGGARPLPGGSHRTTILLAGDQLAALERIREETGYSLGQIVRRALDRFIAEADGGAPFLGRNAIQDSDSDKVA